MVIVGILLMILIGVCILWKINKLKKLEIAAIWLLIPIIIHDVAVVTSNLKIIEIAKNTEMYLSFVMIQILLLPLLLILFFNTYIDIRSVPIRTIISLCLVGILLLVEYTFEWAGIITYKNVNLWASFVFWLLTVFVLSMFQQFFLTSLYKEV
ncbi:hypothetical protein [Metabacillus arenae]|uniref:Uncharacterized protein n=1 Tax=Metabacillus arenae TaxID=2771434 RepID=A0A926NHK5_9BACI|nr:hypothetical protein [Metabacillus arenae]MBD1380713.1 hypothetical protein [Metabacillus arenae]